MKIHFLNVGHGDTTLVDFDGVYMLIDCNISSTNDAAYKYIDKTIPKPQDKNAKKKLDYLVITHPDKDHITGLDIIDENFDIGEYGKVVLEDRMMRKSVPNMTPF